MKLGIIKQTKQLYKQTYNELFGIAPTRRPGIF